MELKTIVTTYLQQTARMPLTLYINNKKTLIPSQEGKITALDGVHRNSIG